MKIRISFFGVLMIISLIATRSYLSLAAMLAAFTHEMGHLLAASLCDVKIKELRLDIFGAALTPTHAFSSYKQELTVAAGGPLVNIIFAIFILIFCKGRGQFLEQFMTASFFLGGLNLLPISDFDGGRILRCSLSYLFSVNAVELLCLVASFLVLFVLWMLSVYMMLQFGASLSLFVFSFALLCKMILLNKSQDYERITKN